MRHHNQNRKLGRVRKQRKALLNSLARSLVLHEKIVTTETKAKEVRPFVEKLLSKARLTTLSATRSIIERVGKTAGKKVTTELAKRYEKRQGGYTRITKMPARKSDGSKMAIIEFVK